MSTKVGLWRLRCRSSPSKFDTHIWHWGHWLQSNTKTFQRRIPTELECKEHRLNYILHFYLKHIKHSHKDSKINVWINHKSNTTTRLYLRHSKYVQWNTSDTRLPIRFLWCFKDSLLLGTPSWMDSRKNRWTPHVVCLPFHQVLGCMKKEYELIWMVNDW